MHLVALDVGGQPTFTARCAGAARARGVSRHDRQLYMITHESDYTPSRLKEPEIL